MADRRLGTHSGRNCCYANEFSPSESTTLFKLYADDPPPALAQRRLSKLNFFRKYRRRNHRPYLGVLTSLVRDPCIVSTGGIPGGKRAGEREAEEKKGLLIEGREQVGNDCERESRLLFATFRGIPREHFTRSLSFSFSLPLSSSLSEHYRSNGVSKTH